MSINIADLGTFASGADIRFTITDADTNLSGRTASVVKVSPRGLVGRVTATISDAAGGVVDVHIEGTDPIAEGRYEFRVQLNGDGLDSIVYPFVMTVA